MAILPGVWRCQGETNGYLIIRDGASLLIDCPATDIAAVLRRCGLPAPELVLHTQVQDEHCREWAAFPDTPVWVPAGSEEIARRSPIYVTACRTRWAADREWQTRGEDPYGIGGCPTERPPLSPLAVRRTLESGERIDWRGIMLEVVALPGSGKHAIGFYWRETGVLFSGDLIHAGGRAVNLYDLERAYELPTGYGELAASLATAHRLAPSLLLPSTGPIIRHPESAVERLQARLAAILAEDISQDAPALTNAIPLRTQERWREVLPGLWQNTNAGNIILFIRKDGDALLVDPGPCLWPGWEEAEVALNADLDMLERDAGLRRVGTALLTHYHGDHVQFCGLLRARYGTSVLATPDVAAVLARPADYRYPCVLDWYGFPFDRLKVDGLLAYGRLFRWHDIPVLPLHTPGHCFAHAAFCLPWQGERVACTGDVLKYGDGPIRLELPILYSDTAWPSRGPAIAFRRLAAWHPTWLLGGHSFACHDPQGTHLAAWRAAVDDLTGKLTALVGKGNLRRAMTPPGYDARRPELM